jgi:hypothetical protein
MKILNEENGNSTAKKLLGLEEYCRQNNIIIDHNPYSGIVFRVDNADYTIVDREDGSDNQEFPRTLDSEVFRRMK